MHHHGGILRNKYHKSVDSKFSSSGMDIFSCIKLQNYESVWVRYDFTCFPITLCVICSVHTLKYHENVKNWNTIYNLEINN